MRGAAADDAGSSDAPAGCDGSVDASRAASAAAATAAAAAAASAAADLGGGGGTAAATGVPAEPAAEDDAVGARPEVCATGLGSFCDSGGGCCMEPSFADGGAALLAGPFFVMPLPASRKLCACAFWGREGRRAEHVAAGSLKRGGLLVGGEFEGGNLTVMVGGELSVEDGGNITVLVGGELQVEEGGNLAVLGSAPGMSTWPEAA